MSDLAVRWVAIEPSAWLRRLRCAAFALSAAVVVSLLVVRLSGSELAALAAGAVVLLAAAAMAARWRPHADAREWSIAADGRIAIRRDRAVCRDAAVVFVSRSLIVLRTGGRTLEIWRDATPIAAFRRLSVAVRWQARRTGPSTPRDFTPSDAAERT